MDEAPRVPVISKPCPMCGTGRLVERQNGENGSRFLGCTNYPETCRHTERLPEYARLIAQGAAQLPGMENL